MVSYPNPLNLPEPVLPVIRQFVTTEYASLTRDGTPMTYPLTPYISDDGVTLDISTGLAYPSKAERARRNPQVCLLYSNPIGSGLVNPPTVLVYGRAAVRDRDLQGNTDRYVRSAFNRFPQSYKSTPRSLLRRLNWYFARIWVQITPMRILWWANGDMNASPQEWLAPQEIQSPPSDPPPGGKGLGAWKELPSEWRSGAVYALSKMGLPVLTVTDNAGYPVPFRVNTIASAADGFRLTVPTGMPTPANRRACLTFHHHRDVFAGQENMLFVGSANRAGSEVHFTVEKRLADWSLGFFPLQVMFNLLRYQFRLKKHLQHEAARRGQPVPVVNLPEGF